MPGEGAAGAPTPVLELRGVTIGWPPDRPLLENVSLRVCEGETLVLMGPGGTGKTVLLKAMNGLIPPLSGQILIHGRDITRMGWRELHTLRKGMGMSFQNYALFDSMTVLQNVGFYLLENTRMPLDEVKRLVKERLADVRLYDIEHLKPVELSGGMRKRVGLARAIVHGPKLLFLDEPTAGLDPISAAAISRMIVELKARLSMTVIGITNELPVARRIADRLAMIWNRGIHAIGPADEILASSDPAVQQFVRGSKDGPIPTLD
jgi:phospholipid/cholesterol/gamma-HCH transport system ATP-binding protein